MSLRIIDGSGENWSDRVKLPLYRPGVVYASIVHFGFLVSAGVFALMAIEDTDHPWLALLAVAFQTGVLVRAWFVGVAIEDGALVHRDWFLTTKYPMAEVLSVSLGRYGGLLQPGYQSIPLKSLVVELDDGRQVRLESTARTPRRARRSLKRFCAVTGIREVEHPTQDEAA